MNKTEKIRAILKQLSFESTRYFSMEALQVNFLPDGLPNFFLDSVPLYQFSPIETFFIIELQPIIKSKFSEQQIRDAYCIALQHLPGEWWGRLGTLNSLTCEHLLGVKDIGQCLINQLDNKKPLRYLEGEEATYAHMYNIQVGDLAALFMGHIHEFKYPLLVKEEIRFSLKQEIKEKFSN